MLATQLSVGKKILLGFAAVLLILAVVGFIGVQALDKSSEGFKGYRALARDTNLVGLVQANLLMQKVSAEEFIFSGSEDANEKYDFYAQRVEEFLARAQVEIQKPERAELVDRFEGNYGEFAQLFMKIKGLIAQRNTLVFDTLDVVGPRMRRTLTEIMESAFRDEDAAAAYHSGVSMQDMMLGRFYMTKFLEDNRIEYFERSMSEFENLRGELAILDRELQNPIRRELLGQVQNLTDQYVETAVQVRDIILTRNRTIEEKFFPVTDALSDDIEQVKLSVMAEQDELGPRLQASNGLAVVNMKVVGAVAGLIGIFLAVFIGRRISGPIVVTTQAAQSIADGDLDIALDAKGGDEVAVLQKSIMSMAASLKRTLDEVREKERIAQEKSVQAEDAAVKANAAMEDAEAKRDSMLHAASELDRVVQAVNEIAIHLSDYVDQAAGGAENQRERSTETATAMEEMNATVLEVAQNSSATAEQAATSKQKAEEGAKMVENVIAAMGEVSNQSDALKTKMADLQGQAKSIGSIMTVITDIADQTNLLALNAAIEAARAGEAGRGFAVVADEVRKLAEKTMQATQEVEKAITGIQSVAEENVRNVDTAVASVGKATGLASQSGDALNEILHLSETSTDQIREIATAAEEQSAASDEINQSVADIDRISQETAAVMLQSREVVHSLETQMNVLRELMNGLTKS